MLQSQEATPLLDRLQAANRLPSPPGVALRVLELCRTDDVEVSDIADVIMSDPALAGRLLRFANSTLSGAQHKANSIRDAVLRLGLRAVKLTALGFSVASPGAVRDAKALDLRRFWTERFAIAVAARRIADRFPDIDREEAFTAALLAGVGRLALAQGVPDEYRKVIERAGSGDDDALLSAERDILGVDHVAFAAALLNRWELPESLVTAVANSREPDNAEGRAADLARIVHAATTLAPLFAASDDQVSQSARDAARRVIESVLELDEPGWTALAERIRDEHLQVARLFDIEIIESDAVLDLYSEAREEATRVGMVAQLEGVRAAESNKELIRKATTDKLTGIANRAKFDDVLDGLVKGIHRGHAHFALILFDVDHFKIFNDTHGHQAGDLVLQRVARACHNALREVDIIARYGGEEFAVLAPHTDRRGACLVAARLRKCIEDLRIDWNGQILKVTISVGVVVTSDYEKLPDAEKIVADADAQLYHSKHSGRNTWSYLGRAASDVVGDKGAPQAA